MKKWILSSLLAAGTLFAEEPKAVYENTFYVDVGSVMLPVPLVGVGYRVQQNHIGFDASVKSALLVVPLGLRANASLLYYPKPDLSNQYYFGAGLSGAETFDFFFNYRVDRYYFGPSALFGNSYHTSSNSKRFWQVGADVYLEKKSQSRRDASFVPLPILTFSYGFGF